MFKAPPSPYLVPPDRPLRVADLPTSPPDDAPGDKQCAKRLKKLRKELAELQRVLYAADRWSVLLIFQAMDAGGKDGTIRAILRGVNPAGCQVFSFKRPSAQELDHDFLWRGAVRLPERGRIGVFNRSYYEEVLVVRVHPEILAGQRLPGTVDPETVWSERFESIRDHERHLGRNGTLILKFWLNVSKDEQRRRFLARIDEPEKNWKFSTGDVAVRSHWDAYMQAFEEALAATSTPWSPWYAIPADSKPFARLTVAELVVGALRSLDLRYPEADEETRARFGEMRELLEGEDA